MWIKIFQNCLLTINLGSINQIRNGIADTQLPHQSHHMINTIHRVKLDLPNQHLDNTVIIIGTIHRYYHMINIRHKTIMDNNSQAETMQLLIPAPLTITDKIRTNLHSSNMTLMAITQLLQITIIRIFKLKIMAETMQLISQILIDPEPLTPILLPPNTLIGINLHTETVLTMVHKEVWAAHMLVLEHSRWHQNFKLKMGTIMGQQQWQEEEISSHHQEQPCLHRESILLIDTINQANMDQ